MMVAVVIVVDLLELELDEVYPDEDGDFAGGVELLQEVSVNVRSTVQKISWKLRRTYGVGGLVLTDFNSSVCCFRKSRRSLRFSMVSSISRRRSCSSSRISRKSPNRR